jgi:hypothetical protein
LLLGRMIGRSGACEGSPSRGSREGPGVERNPCCDLASRLEQLTKEQGARLIVSEDVMTAIGDAAGAATALDAVALKGYAAPVRAWRLA